MSARARDLGECECGVSTRASMGWEVRLRLRLRLSVSISILGLRADGDDDSSGGAVVSGGERWTRW